MLPFLKNFKKELEKLENVSTEFRPPSHWYTTNNYGLNKILSGDFHRGVPQGRVTILAGPSDTGKSYLLSNIMKGAQDDGAFILAIDSENALDTDYLGRIGVEVSPDKFLGVAVVTISDVVSSISDFIKMYEKEYGKYNAEAPKILIAIDSLDMLLTDTENANFNEGIQKGDQGQRAKQMKAFLRTTVSRIKALNIALIATHQVYPADPLKGEGLWAINGAIRYSASQIVLITKLKLKDGVVVTGIKMKCETFKSRFAKLGSKVEIEVPRSTGMNKNSGLLELLVEEKILEKNGGWYSVKFPDQDLIKFQEGKLTDEFAKRLLSHPDLIRAEKALEALFSTPETDVEAGAKDPDNIQPLDDVEPEIVVVSV